MFPTLALLFEISDTSKSESLCQKSFTFKLPLSRAQLGAKKKIKEEEKKQTQETRRVVKMQLNAESS